MRRPSPARSAFTLLAAAALLSLGGCGSPSAAPTTPATAAATAGCRDGATRCDGAYAGQVKEGNNPPAGAQVQVCKSGRWTLQEACDGAQNLGCYAIDDPATGEVEARCVSAFAEGE